MTTVGGLVRIEVSDLFDTRDYSIRLDPETPTILTGANGTGKSTILRLVRSAASGEFLAITRTPFKRLELEFASGPSLIISRTSPGKKALHVRWGERRSTVFGTDSELPEWALDVLMSGATGEHLERELFYQLRAREIRATQRNAVMALSRGGIESLEGFGQPSWYEIFRRTFPVLYISDQRLVIEPPRDSQSERRATRPVRLAVEAASLDIAQRMRQVDSAYARISQEQDRLFPDEVIRAMADVEIFSAEELNNLIDTIARRRDSLRDVGLLGDESLGPSPDMYQLDQPHVRAVIWTFLTGTLRKLSVLEDLSARLRSFKAFLDERFSEKELRLSRHDGLLFELPGGRSIKPGELSSGEQQMLVLAYEILFRTDEGTLVVVDEPEISLHVLWQDTLVDRLIEMGRPGKLQYLMATHSPVLTTAHSEFERSLDWIS